MNMKRLIVNYRQTQELLGFKRYKCSLFKCSWSKIIKDLEKQRNVKPDLKVDVKKQKVKWCKIRQMQNSESNGKFWTKKSYKWC